MTGLAAALLSIGVIAAFVLLGGGLWQIFRRGERNQGLLMVCAALVTFANVLIWTV